MSRIIESLKQAVRYAKGDKHAGHSTVIQVRADDALLEKARRGEGMWIPNRDMHPTTNICDRVYRKHDGTFGIFRNFDGSVQLSFVDAWFFTEDQIWRDG